MTPAEAEALRQRARELGLDAHPTFWSVTADVLALALNGIGPSWLPQDAVDLISKNQGRFAAAAAIHAWDFFRSTSRFSDFVEANKRFRDNCFRTVRRTISPARFWKRGEMFADAETLYVFVCAFGWPGYKAEAQKAEEAA